MNQVTAETNMLSPWLRKIMLALLLAIIVGWWMPKIIHPPRVLPTPVKDFINAYAPPHLDPLAEKNIVEQKPVAVVNTKVVKTDPKDIKWAVQIGSYRVLTQIQPTIDELKSHGYSVVVHPVKMNDKMLYRIWVGELDSRAAAKNLSVELKTRFNLQGFVLRLGDV